MRKQPTEDYPTKAKKREIKKRPRMNMHGAALRVQKTHSGKKLTSRWFSHDSN